MFVPDTPSFDPRWLRHPPREPEWLSDPDSVPPGERAVYAHAKTGLHAVLSDLDRDGVALLPEFLPSGVVRAVAGAGFDVQYYPVGADLTLPADDVENRITKLDPAVVLFVHYFGFADPQFRRLARAADDAGAFVVEDAARGLFARRPDGQHLGATGDAAVFSLRKILAVPAGGLVVAPGMDLPEPQGSAPSARAFVESVAVALARRVGWAPWTGAEPEVPTAAGTTSDPLPAEGRSPTAPDRLTRVGLAQCSPGAVRSTRRHRYRTLREHLAETVEVLTPPPYEDASPFGVAFALPDPETCGAVLSALHRRGLPATAYTWPVRVDGFPGARPLRESTVVVPTHQQFPVAALERVATTVADTLQ